MDINHEGAQDHDDDTSSACVCGSLVTLELRYITHREHEIIYLAGAEELHQIALYIVMMFDMKWAQVAIVLAAYWPLLLPLTLTLFAILARRAIKRPPRQARFISLAS